MELGIKDEENEVYKQANDVADNVLENLENIDIPKSKEKISKTYNSKNSRYIFNMNVYCEKLDETELNNIFNYINKRFGAEY